MRKHSGRSRAKGRKPSSVTDLVTKEAVLCAMVDRALQSIQPIARSRITAFDNVVYQATVAAISEGKENAWEAYTPYDPTSGVLSPDLCSTMWGVYGKSKRQPSLTEAYDFAIEIDKRVSDAFGLSPITITRNQFRKHLKIAKDLFLFYAAMAMKEFTGLVTLCKFQTFMRNALCGFDSINALKQHCKALLISKGDVAPPARRLRSSKSHHDDISAVTEIFENADDGMEDHVVTDDDDDSSYAPSQSKKKIRSRVCPRKTNNKAASKCTASLGGCDLGDNKKRAKATEATVKRQQVLQDKLKWQERNENLHIRKELVSEGMETIERPLLKDALKNSGASIFTGCGKQAVLIEDLVEGATGSDGQSWAIDVKGDKVKGYWILPLGNAGFYGFAKSNRVFHMEIGTEPIDRSCPKAGLSDLLQEHDADKGYEETAKLLESLEKDNKRNPKKLSLLSKLRAELEISEFDLVLWAADKYGKACHIMPSKGSDTSNPFVKVAHEDSLEFKKLHEDLSYDAPKMIKQLLSMKENKDPALNLPSSENNKRGTLSIDIGFGDQHYNHAIPVDKAPMRSTMPHMIHLPGPGKEHLAEIYEAVGGIADRLTMWMDTECSDDGGHFDDEERTEMFGVPFRRAMKAHLSRYEACTVALTKIAENGELNKEMMVERHTDGPNDFRKGYDTTFIYWINVEIDGTVYRLTHIFYSRTKAGYSMVRERCYMRPAFEIYQRYTQRPEVLDYDRLHWQAEHLEEYDFRLGNGDAMRFKRTWACTNPNGNYSSIVASIDDAAVTNELPYERIVELFFIAQHSHNPAAFVYVVSQMTSNGVFSQPGNLVHKYLETVAQLGSSVGEGECPRFNFAHGAKDGLFFCTAEVIAERLAIFQEAIDGANSGWDYDMTINKLQEIKYLKDVSTISFYSVGVFLGILHSAAAMRESFKAKLCAASAMGRYIVDSNPDLFRKGPQQTAKELGRFLKQLAKQLQVPLYVAENGACKAARADPICGKAKSVRKIWECYREDQPLYHRTMGNDGTVQLFVRRISEKDWRPYNVPARIKPIFA